jgi:outer membrane protein OmpA-like peptidoglycan-associated protein
MKIKIGAFTDKTNDETADLKLTEQQANSVAGALKKAGANSTQIVSAEGYGSKYARVPINAPINEKVKDRKISINVTEK